MRGSIGLVIGLAIGAGAMYLVLRPPWAKPVPVASSGPPVVLVPSDAGVKPPKRKRPRSEPATRRDGDGDGGGGDDDPMPVLTASDRALEWRGEEVALPARSINMADSARALDDDEINSTIQSQTGPVRDCVVQSATNTDLRATITVKLLVDGRGRVTKSRLQAPRYLFEQGLLGCAQRALGRLSFAATGAPTVVTMPVTLN